MEGTIITKKGMKLLLKILAAKGSLHICRAAVGTGTILTGYDPASMLDLVQYKMDGAISMCETAGDVARITMQLCSEDVENGFIISEAGIFALDPDEGEILYAYIDLRDDPQYMYAKGTKTVKFIEITLDVLIEANMPVSAYINPNSLISRKEFENHAAEQQEMIDATYRQATGYTDQKVADLINGAPSTLDTLNEIAEAMEKNADVVAALEAAIGLKADAAEFDTLQKTAQTKNGDAKDNIVSFDSKDGASPTGWLDWVAMKSKETLSELLSKVSIVANNVRWIYRMLGSTDISAIGGGTVTGAISALNTGMTQINERLVGVRLYCGSAKITTDGAGRFSLAIPNTAFGVVFNALNTGAELMCDVPIYNAAWGTNKWFSILRTQYGHDIMPNATILINYAYWAV